MTILFAVCLVCLIVIIWIQTVKSNVLVSFSFNGSLSFVCYIREPVGGAVKLNVNATAITQDWICKLYDDCNDRLLLYLYFKCLPLLFTLSWVTIDVFVLHNLQVLAM